MALDWLKAFQHRAPKEPGYAEKRLKAYALGIRAKGALAGVVVEPGPGCCAAARALPPGRVYAPGDAPRLPLPGCPRGDRCDCVYRPAMTYPDREEP
jgi:hypothetical protein